MKHHYLVFFIFHEKVFFSNKVQPLNIYENPPLQAEYMQDLIQDEMNP